MDVVSNETIYELIGVLLGDGYILCKPSQYRIEISGHPTEELPYFQSYLIPLLRNFTDNVHLLRCHNKKGSSIRAMLLT